MKFEKYVVKEIKLGDLRNFLNVYVYIKNMRKWTGILILLHFEITCFILISKNFITEYPGDKKNSFWFN